MRYTSHIVLGLAIVALLAGCGQHRQSEESASPTPAASLQPATNGALGETAAPSPGGTVAAASKPGNGLRNRYVIKVPAGPNHGSVVFTVGMNGESPTAFSAPGSEGDISEALHRGRNNIVVGSETDASSSNIADLRIGEQMPSGRWNTVFSLEVGTGAYGRFPGKGTRKYSIYAR